MHRDLFSDASHTGGFAAPIAVSVIVPAYKIADEIDRCLESLAAQTLPSLEVLVVNDGSPDATGAKAQDWADKFPHRFRVIDKPNGGCASARAEGLRQARGAFVGFVDGDDWVDPPMFEALYQAAIQSASEIAQCGFSEAFADGTRVAARETVDIGGARHGGSCIVTDPLKLLPLRPSIWRRIYRRDFLLQNGIKFAEHIRRFDDLPFQFETFVCARRVAVIADPYYVYRQDRPDQDTAISDEKFFVHFELFDWLDKRLVGRSSLEIERQLFRAELCCHIWAQSKLDGRLKRRYIRAAAAHLSRPRSYIKSRDKIAMGCSVNDKALRLALRSMLGASIQTRSHLSKTRNLSPTI